MILHHETVAMTTVSSALALLSWVMLGISAVIYYTRLLWARIKGGK